MAFRDSQVACYCIDHGMPSERRQEFLALQLGPWKSGAEERLHVCVMLERPFPPGEEQWFRGVIRQESAGVHERLVAAHDLAGAPYRASGPHTMIGSCRRRLCGRQGIRLVV